MTDYINDYCMHDHTCGQLRASDVDSQVTLTGWVWLQPRPWRTHLR